MEIKKENRGGSRTGAGRKKISDKKISINIFPRKSVIEKFHGEKKFKIEIAQRMGYDSITGSLIDPL